ncbi:hypothetical protein KI387_035007, partial [Taxus chinensis]
IDIAMKEENSNDKASLEAPDKWENEEEFSDEEEGYCYPEEGEMLGEMDEL